MFRGINIKTGLWALLSSAILMVGFTGCATGNLEKIPRASVGSTQTVEYGTVVAVRHVHIEGESTNVGWSGGAIMGGAIGSTVGNGTGRTLATAGGAVAGGVIGSKIEKELTAKLAQEVTIELDDGGTVVVVQEVSDPEFTYGDRVSLLETAYGTSRVRHETFGDPMQFMQ